MLVFITQTSPSPSLRAKATEAAALEAVATEAVVAAATTATAILHMSKQILDRYFRCCFVLALLDLSRWLSVSLSIFSSLISMHSIYKSKHRHQQYQVQYQHKYWNGRACIKSTLLFLFWLLFVSLLSLAVDKHAVCVCLHVCLATILKV